MKTALLVALASIKRVGDLHAFSIDEACLEFVPDYSHMILRSQPGYVPKVLTIPFQDQVVDLQALPLEEADPALALSSMCSPRLCRQNSVLQDLRPAFCLLWWEAEEKGSLQAKAVSLDNGHHCFGIPAARLTVPPWCDSTPLGL